AHGDGDADGDGDVDGEDLVFWKGQYGFPVPLSTILAVPEPPSLCLLLWGLLAFYGRRRDAS
ncbi:MAG: PEP-CTERM sorting domain-containing protein, partial [Planctomycetes bacterium]|nr:PEP-CTERM sorting domain-containing protein [Planctomycetota bacterium]